METTVVIVIAILTAFLGAVLGFLLKSFLLLRDKNSIEIKIKDMETEARAKSSDLILEAQKKAGEITKEASAEIRSEKEILKNEKDHFVKREVSLEKRELFTDEQTKKLKEKIEKVESIRERSEKIEEEKAKKLQEISSLTPDQAKEEIFNKIEKEASADLMIRIDKLENYNKEKIENRAKEILVTSIHRYGNAIDQDMLSLSVKISDDDLKGKIIGKEGRNIKSFESATGVQLLIDEKPGTIVISCYDPVRRVIAKEALDVLLKDGRIQPARIEEVVEETKKNIVSIMEQKGKEACKELGLFNLDPKLVSILGRLHFRTSYGQNVLTHSVEMAHISRVMAEQLGADPYVAKMGALFHDIGKAVDHEIEGTHVEIGRRILSKFGVDEESIKAMQAHHEEYPYENVESIIVQVADAISGGRPGARSDTAEMYIKKLEGLERISNSVPGVLKSYAIAAGREIRVFVSPDEVDDYKAHKIAKRIALQVETELKYPGEIKVSVIRETRIIEYAR